MSKKEKKRSPVDMPINCNGETGTKSRRCKIPEARLHMHFHQIVDSTKILPQSVIRLVILRQGVADAVVRLLLHGTKGHNGQVSTGFRISLQWKIKIITYKGCKG